MTDGKVLTKWLTDQDSLLDVRQTREEIQNIVLNHSGSRALLATANALVWWDLTGGQEVAVLPTESSASAIAISGAEPYVAAVGYADGTAAFFRIAEASGAAS